jgi:hypothetical protein
MDRHNVEEDQNEEEQEPITLEIQDGFIGGDSAFSEGD